MSPPANLPPLGPERAVPTPHVDAATLPNGLAVQVVPRPGVPLVTVRLVTHGGRLALGLHRICERVDALGDPAHVIGSG